MNNLTKHTSTPVQVPFPNRRRSIHADRMNVTDTLSPINSKSLPNSPKHKSPKRSFSKIQSKTPSRDSSSNDEHESDMESLSENSDSDNEFLRQEQYSESKHRSYFEQENSRKSVSRNNAPNLGSQNLNLLYFISGAGVILAVCFGFIVQSENPETPLLLDTSGVPSQGDDFWFSIKVAIEEILDNERPVTIVFLYKENSKDTLNTIIKRVSEYGVCKIRNCSKKPIKVLGKSLSDSSITSDYGKFITKYREPLKENGVMIVENLENVPGISAQVYHSFCDQYSPLVKKSLFLFTMKVEQYSKDNLAMFEKRLRSLWSDIDDDKFYPLYTRISEVVLPIL